MPLLILHRHSGPHSVSDFELTHINMIRQYLSATSCMLSRLDWNCISSLSLALNILSFNLFKQLKTLELGSFSGPLEDKPTHLQELHWLPLSCTTVQSMLSLFQGNDGVLLLNTFPSFFKCTQHPTPFSLLLI